MFESPDKKVFRLDVKLKIPTPLNPEEVRVLKDFIRKFKIEANTPGMSDFAETYGNEEIEKDTALLQKRLQSFKKEETLEDKNHKFQADLLEIVIAEFASYWLPGKIYKTGLYDDIQGGIDLVLEIDDALPIRLAIDVTSDLRAVSKKIEDINDGYSYGDCPETKYFHSKISSETGKLKMPGTIIGLDRQELVGYARLFLAKKNNENPRVGNPERLRATEQQLADDEIGSHFRREILAQLRLAPLIFDNTPPSVENELLRIHINELIKKIETFGANKKAPAKTRLKEDRIEEAVTDAVEKLSQLYKAPAIVQHR